ncbi:hypothetical protein, partial [Rhizobium favelukesii]|uniref:hypothetical protein n=1 Tax=Rhizobium favelukesii TaxID=348824 RepID=UPI0021604235
TSNRSESHQYPRENPTRFSIQVRCSRLHDHVDIRQPQLSNVPVNLTKALALANHRNVAGLASARLISLG